MDNQKPLRSSVLDRNHRHAKGLQASYLFNDKATKVWDFTRNSIESISYFRSWEQACDQLGAETYIFSLVEFDGDLYGGTNPNGKLYKLNATKDGWVEACAKLGAETRIYSLVEFDGDLYGGTNPNGKLYKLNATKDGWVEVCDKLGAETQIRSLAVFDGDLYGGTYPNGKLYKKLEYINSKTFTNVLSVVNASWVADGMQFDANGEYASLDNTNQIVNSEAGTIVLWFKSLSSFGDSSAHTLLGKWGGVSTNGDFTIIKSGGNKFFFWFVDNTTFHYIRFALTSFPTWQTGSFIAAQWDRGNAIYDSKNMAININGNYITPDASANATSWNQFTVASDLYIGNDASQTDFYCNGIISDSRFYNKVVPEDTIADIYENPYDSLIYLDE